MLSKRISFLCRVLVGAVVTVSVFCLGYNFSQVQTLKSSIDTIQSPMQMRLAIPKHRCPSVLDYMTQGHWKTRPLTTVEHQMTERFYHNALNNKGVPKSLQRPDGRCGDIGYDHVTRFLRAMCSPTGQTPCCYNFKCVNRTQQQCQCKHCWDLRQQIHAEYSTWIPSDARCKPRQYSSKQSCELLDGGSIYFIGDSILRHIYTGFLMTLRGNFKDGGVKPTETKDWKVKCSGMYMYEERNCRVRLDATPTNICRGRVKISWKLHYVVRKWKDLIYDVTDKISNPRTLFVVGIGLHDNCNSTRVKVKYLKPTLDVLRKVGILWPKFLFVDVNAAGIMKQESTQSKPFILRFNKDIGEFLNTYNIPMLKTFNMTDGVRSFDGTHYALGTNKVKANILLNYIQELRDNGVW